MHDPFSGVMGIGFIQELVKGQFIAEKRAWFVQSITSDHNDFLAWKQFFGNDGCQATEEMVFTINYDFFVEHWGTGRVEL